MKNWVLTTIMCAMLTAPLSLTAATASAQVGYGTSGGGAYGRGMDMSAVLMQQRVFSSALGGRGGAAARMTKAQQREIQAQKERGRLVIRDGRATTTFHPADTLLAPRKWAAARTNDPRASPAT